MKNNARHGISPRRQINSKNIIISLRGTPHLSLTRSYMHALSLSLSDTHTRALPFPTSIFGLLRTPGQFNDTGKESDESRSKEENQTTAFDDPLHLDHLTLTM